MNYIFQRVEHSKVVRGADGKYVGARSVFTHETDKDGNLKEIAHEEYNLNDKGEWETANDGGGMYVKDAKLSEDGKHVNVTVTDEKPEPKPKFKDGDILKAEYPTYNVYAANLDDEKAHWILITSLNPGKNQFIGLDHAIDYDSVDGVVFDDLQKATREEVFSVERFIEANTGYRWDWRNKELVKV